MIRDLGLRALALFLIAGGAVLALDGSGVFRQRASTSWGERGTSPAVQPAPCDGEFCLYLPAAISSAVGGLKPNGCYQVRCVPTNVQWRVGAGWPTALPTDPTVPSIICLLGNEDAIALFSSSAGVCELRGGP